MEQIEMFSDHVATPPKRSRIERVKSVESKRPPQWKRTIEDRFVEFNAAHPEVHAELRRLALEQLYEGRRRISVKHLAEVARYNLRNHANVEEGGYRLNNSLVSRFARALIAETPALAEVVETRELRSR